MSPLVVARYTEFGKAEFIKTLSHFLLNTRGLSRVQTLLSPFQKNGENRGDFYGMKVKCCRGEFHIRRPNVKQIFVPYLWGRGPTWVLDPSV